MNEDNMKNYLMLRMDKNGVFHAYDDTYDLTIHFESQEEQDAFIEKVRQAYQTPENRQEQDDDDLISRKALLDEIEKWDVRYDEDRSVKRLVDLGAVYELVADAPPAESNT